MKPAPSATGTGRLRRAAMGFVAAAAVISTAGCSASNYMATTHQYSGSDGVRADIGEVQFRHIMFVANEQGGDARLLGAVNNRTGDDVSIEIEAAGDAFTFDLAPESWPTWSTTRSTSSSPSRPHPAPTSRPPSAWTARSRRSERPSRTAPWRSTAPTPWSSTASTRSQALPTWTTAPSRGEAAPRTTRT
ncbi:hypothetical protein [Nesterenkonia pannonica]|uniref:hypothetical protein n=1 Tax=Nesterenkonia pannonica TaxID=1548602 RepID=UPI00216424DE|nr:hypothetical protein [Nesterenkonia pannonica]